MTPSIPPYQKPNPAFFVLGYKKTTFEAGVPDGLPEIFSWRKITHRILTQNKKGKHPVPGLVFAFIF